MDDKVAVNEKAAVKVMSAKDRLTSPLTAICGEACSIKVGSDVFLGHKFSIPINANQIDVRAFGSGTWGAWLACAWNGEIVISTYSPLSEVPVDATPSVGTQVVADITAISPNATWVMDGSLLMGIKRDVDAKGIEEFEWTFKVTSLVAS